jgi:hypothetical protein
MISQRRKDHASPHAGFTYRVHFLSESVFKDMDIFPATPSRILQKMLASSCGPADIGQSTAQKGWTAAPPEHAITSTESLMVDHTICAMRIRSIIHCSAPDPGYERDASQVIVLA